MPGTDRKALQLFGSVPPGVSATAPPGGHAQNQRGKSVPRVLQAVPAQPTAGPPSVAAREPTGTSLVTSPLREQLGTSVVASAFRESGGNSLVTSALREPVGTSLVTAAANTSQQLASSLAGGGATRGVSPTPPHFLGSRLTSQGQPPASPLGIRRTLPPSTLSSSVNRGGINELLRSTHSVGQSLNAVPFRAAPFRSSSQRPSGSGRCLGDSVTIATTGDLMSEVSAKQAGAPVALPFSSVAPPQVSASLRSMRASSQSPQRSTLPASWVPRRAVPESPATASARVAASRSPMSHHVVPSAAICVDTRVRSQSPDRLRSVFVHSSPTRSVAPERASPSKPRQELVPSDYQDAVDFGNFVSRQTTWQDVHGEPPVDSDPLQLDVGVEVCLGDHQLRCLNVLGSGSYSIVWRAEVLRCNTPRDGTAQGAGCHGQGSRMLLEEEVALKDVLCRSNAVLRQSLFEVQLLLALERKILLDNGTQSNYLLRLPRCFAYKVDSREEGWRVRTAMTRLPGEQLDDWLRRSALSATSMPDVTWTSQLKRGLTMSETLVRQIGPTLQRLAPLAWHRDVNSHNVLVSEDGSGNLLCETPEHDGSNASFWLIDLGLAVDARTWVSPEENNQGGTWRVTDIGGDCRYWPASSWMVHLYGADYLAEREDYCRQYQWRLDSFGLGITAVELMCSTALAARLAGAEPVEPEKESDVCWARLLDAWQRYYERAGNWWAEIYKVFSTGGDFRPVHAWLVEELVADQVVALMGDLREGLRSCMACAGDESSARILHVVSELIDEASEHDLLALCQMFPEEASASQQNAASERTGYIGRAEGSSIPCPVEPEIRAETVAPILEAYVQNGVGPHASSTEVVALELRPELQPWPNMELQAQFEAASTQECRGVEQTASPEVLMQEAFSLASAAAQEGREALASLPPIPSIAAEPVSKAPANARHSSNRQTELSELIEAQAQLRHDLERLQLAKMRLQHARRVHEDKKNSATAAMQAEEAARLAESGQEVSGSMMQSMGAGNRRPASRGPPQTRSRDGSR